MARGPSNPTQLTAVMVLTLAARAACTVPWSYNRCDEVYGPLAWPKATGQCKDLDQQSPLDLCDALDVRLLEPSVPGLPECLNFLYSDLSNNGYVQTRLTIGDGLRLGFRHPEGSPLSLQACSLPVRVGRQVYRNGSFAAITWKLNHAELHWGQQAQTASGSEHLLEGRAHDVEVQFFHYNNRHENYGAALQSNQPDAILVVAQVTILPRAVQEACSLPRRTDSRLTGHGRCEQLFTLDSTMTSLDNDTEAIRTITSAIVNSSAYEVRLTSLVAGCPTRQVSAATQRGRKLRHVSRTRLTWCRHLTT